MRKIQSIKTLQAVLIVTALMMTYQNCSKKQFTTINPEQSASLGNPVADLVTNQTTSEPVCKFNGQPVASNSSVDAFQNSSVNYGESCVKETRLCKAGVLSGSYNFSECQVGQPKMCLFNGQSIAHGATLLAYQSSAVEFGSACQKQERVCSNGVLSGSYAFGACAIGSPKSCLFNNQTVNHGESVMTFQNSTVGFGKTCASEKRACTNGVLSGSFNYASCEVGQAASCLFNGRTLAHNESVKAFKTSSVSYGGSCESETRSCQNGVLSGQNQYSSCEVGAASRCQFNGAEVAHGATVVAFKTSSVAYGQACERQERTCSNGALAGSYAYSSCQADSPKSCLFNGQTIPHGEYLTTFLRSQVEYNQTCDTVSVRRQCLNGALSGDSQAVYGSCAVNSPRACLFNGQTVPHGTSVSAYASSKVEFGDLCRVETRSCQDGQLSGSYTSGTCEVAAPESPAACGSSNGASLDKAPTSAAELCGAGSASTVSGSGPWSWTCSQKNSQVTCGAQKVNKCARAAWVNTCYNSNCDSSFAKLRAKMPQQPGGTSYRFIMFDTFETIKNATTYAPPSSYCTPSTIGEKALYIIVSCGSNNLCGGGGAGYTCECQP